MLVFDAAQFDGILKKILEFNSSLQSDSVNKPKFENHFIFPCISIFTVYKYLGLLLINGSLLKERNNLSINDADLSRLTAIVKILKDTSHYHTSRFSDVDLALVLRLLKTWPLSMLFPGNHLILKLMFPLEQVLRDFMGAVMFYAILVLLMLEVPPTLSHHM